MCCAVRAGGRGGGRGGGAVGAGAPRPEKAGNVRSGEFTKRFRYRFVLVACCCFFICVVVNADTKTSFAVKVFPHLLSSFSCAALAFKKKSTASTTPYSVMVQACVECGVARLGGTGVGLFDAFKEPPLFSRSFVCFLEDFVLGDFTIALRRGSRLPCRYSDRCCSHVHAYTGSLTTTLEGNDGVLAPCVYFGSRCTHSCYVCPSSESLVVVVRIVERCKRECGRLVRGRNCQILPF